MVILVMFRRVVREFEVLIRVMKYRAQDESSIQIELIIQTYFDAERQHSQQLVIDVIKKQVAPMDLLVRFQECRILKISTIYNMSSTQIKEVVAKILQQKIARYQPTDFQGLLIILSSNNNLQGFIQEVYNAREQLKVLSADLRDILQAMANQQQLFQTFGRGLLKLWLEFEIISFFKLKERLQENELDNYPCLEKEQLELFKYIGKKYYKSYSEGSEFKLLDTISNKSIYQKLLKEITNQTKGLATSKIKQSKFVPISDLKINDLQKLSLKLLSKISYKIEAVTTQTDQQAIHLQLKEMLDSIMEKGEDLEKELLKRNFKQVIFNLLHIKIHKNNCEQIPKTNDSLKESYKSFKLFYSLQSFIVGMDQAQDNLLNRVQYALVDTKTVWYWPCITGPALISFLRNQCINDKRKMQNLVQLLNKYQPKLRERIYNFKNREFLQQALEDVQENSQKGIFVNCLMELANKQQVDLKRPLENSSNYMEMLQELHVPVSRLALLRSTSESYPDPFCILDLKHNKMVRIQLTNQHVAELKENVTNFHSYQGKRLDNFQYCLQYILTSQTMMASYRKVGQNETQGYLMMANIMEYGQRLKQGSWGIINLQGTKVNITQIESDIISEQLVKLKKNQKINKFSLKISDLQQTVDINTQTLIVEAYSKSSVGASRIKCQYGYLIFIPSYKKSEEEAESAVEDPVDSPDLTYRQVKGGNVKSMIEADQKENKVQNQVKTFKWLGYFKDYFQAITGYEITKENHIQAQKQHAIQYFQKWQAVDFFQLISTYLLNQHIQRIQESVSKMFKVGHKVEVFLAKRLKEINQKAKVQLVYQYNSKSQTLSLKNMKPQRQAHLFFRNFFQYFTCLQNQQRSKKSYPLDLTADELKYVKQREANDSRHDIRIVSTVNNKAQILCTKQAKQQLLNQIKALDQIHEFIFENVNAFELMKENEKQFLQNIGLKQLEKHENTFKISFKLKHLPQFKGKLKFACEMQQAGSGEKRQIQRPKEAAYLHLYRSKLGNIDPDISVIKMGQDLLIQFNSKLERLVMKAFAEIEQDKQKEMFEIFNAKSDTYGFKNVEQQFIYSFKKKLLKIFSQQSLLGSKAHLNIDLVRKGVYALQAIQTTKEELEIMKSQIKLFQTRLRQFKQCKSQIYDTMHYFNRAFNRIPAHQRYGKKIKDLNFQLKAKLKEELTEVINKTTDQSFKNLENEFLQYLQNNSLESNFEPNSVKQNKAKLKTQTQGVKIFTKFIDIKIQDFQKQSTVKDASLKQKILSQLQQIKNQLEQRYIESKLEPSHMKRFFKSLNILLTIYYGQQLPITAYLQSFRKKLEQNDVVMVKVGTGSGKSTVIPPYLVGVGKQKVVVTQPRRLPCKQIYYRITNVFGDGISGYQVADASRDKDNSLVYMTDGLLKIRVIFNEEVLDQIDVLVIDQIHQRSANIDILLLQLNQYYKKKERKLKLVLCSATIEQRIGKLFSDIGLKVDKFEVKTDRYQVKEFAIKEGNIIDKVAEMSKKLINNQQMLVFIPGQAEVEKTVKILSEKYNKTAYALTARVQERQQEAFLQNGHIFISTSIAETSLTFKNLKYVVDSRLSRWRKFNPKLELMETEEGYSSNSSIAQRKGRLGRTRPGQYYYLQYHDKDFVYNRQHNSTELEKINLTNVIFQLLLKQGRTFKDVELLLKKLEMNESNLQQKLSYSKGILEGLLILNKDGSLRNNVQKILQFGNLGNPQHNVGLYSALQENCLINMIYLVSFQMYGAMVAAGMIEYSRTLNKGKGGDIRAIHDFLVAVGQKIAIQTVSWEHLQDKLKVECKQLVQKPWFSILRKIMIKAKQLMIASSSNLVASPSQWGKVIRIMTITYPNKVFFKQSLFGGNQKLYEKVRKDLLLSYDDQKMNQEGVDISYILNFTFSSKKKDKLPDLVMSLNSEINAMSECILSVCEELQVQQVKQAIGFKIIGSECKKQCFDSLPLDEKKTFEQIYSVIRGSFSSIGLTYNYPSIEIKGCFTEVAKVVQVIVEPKRRNKELKMSLKYFLQSALKSKQISYNYNKLAAVIDPEHSRMLFEKLTFNDYRRLFDAIRYEMKNKFDVEIEWDLKEKVLKVSNAKNFQLNRLVNKVASFFKWFCDCQIISREEFKVKPHYIGDPHSYTKEMRNKLSLIMERVNQIVDSKLEHYVLKGWVSGRGRTKCPRTARMIAVCWVLVNIFSCTIKGGFVRDWVVNGEEWVPPTSLERASLLKPNPRNQYKEVLDDKVTPNDIDAELPETIDFDVHRFKKEMKKLGIAVDIKEDGWRKHVTFDDNTESGGFTADLIEPYTSLTHYTYDFDANVMFIKKDHTNAIGMKIPLVYQNEFSHSIKKVEINDLIELCTKKQMTALKADIPNYRFDKFKSKGWTISMKEQVQPICYKSQFTQSFIQPVENLQRISPAFQKMVQEKNLTVMKIEQLRNKGWDDAFEASQSWIINELQKFQKKNNPDNYDIRNIHSNNKVLFHGTKTVEGAKGIKEFGFDGRYFNAGGLYGKGAYFADDPAKSHDYTSGPTRYMFLVNVALGKQEVLKATNNTRLGPGKDYHSILGQHSKQNEYIVDRWGQAKPLYLITYK